MGIRKRKKLKSKNGFVYEAYIHYYENGKRKSVSKSGFATKKEAQNWEYETECEINRVTLQQKPIKLNTGRTLMDVTNEFMEIGSSHYQANTIYNSKKDIKYFEKNIGRIQIDKIDYQLLQKFFNNRRNCGIETNKNIRKTLNRVLTYALKCGYIHVNPIQYVFVSGEDRSKSKNIVDYDTYTFLANQIKEKNTFQSHSYAIAIHIGYYTGLRISEVTALEKSDFNFIKSEITVNKKLVFKGLHKNEYYSTKEMKSKASKAVIPFPNALKEIISQWFKENPFNLVVCDANGNYVNPTCITNALRDEAKKLGIRMNFHMLRHTYATTLITNDVDIKTAQELLRHNNVNTTLSIYTHIKDEHKKQVVNSIFG